MNKINGLEKTMADKSGVCLSNGDGCGDCFGPFSFSLQRCAHSSNMLQTTTTSNPAAKMHGGSQHRTNLSRCTDNNCRILHHTSSIIQ